MTDAFEKFVKDNPEMMERTRKPYYEKTEDRLAQWTLALEKIDEGYPRKVVINRMFAASNNPCITIF